jgi:DHA2 family methylenomycin A resistance protein-like MFS transporter
VRFGHQPDRDMTAPHNAVDAIHTLSLIMAVGPIAAIILALWLIKPFKARR